ncbi:hypothetical protein [Agrobacterium sp. OT33]|uniref:hypothetical protein n=1 Tax=Agrobacterium sp. OT33 TaxID=2815338 RepID=UPI001A8E89D6|nr:hypothetical protein [Agrobacterium sp. OT33]MBO0125099.1 hypothetical protein [Agrobacterium sp. OT33]
MFVFPDELAALRRYLDGKHADTSSFKSARHAAFVACRLAELEIKFPKDKSASMFPILLRIQRELLKKHKWLAKVKKDKTKRRNNKLTTEQRVAASNAVGWVRTVGAAKFDSDAEGRYRDKKLGTFGPASAVKKIDPAEYLAEKEKSKS